jgi:hypothetical protein
MKTNKDYPLIPMSEITDEARKIAVAWMECEDKNWIGQKHKLASDIMNYAKKFATQFGQFEQKEEENIMVKGAWPFIDVLKKLVESADILLHKKDYDGHGWEQIEICFKRGQEIIKELESTPLQTVIMPSDSEIENLIQKVLKERNAMGVIDLRNGRNIVKEFLKSQLKAIVLRDELIKLLKKVRVMGYKPDGYIVWSRIENTTLRIRTSAELVDEYLTQK